MIHSIGRTSGHIARLFSLALAQAAYLRRHGHLRDLSGSGVEASAMPALERGRDGAGGKRSRTRPAALLSSWQVTHASRR